MEKANKFYDWFEKLGGNLTNFDTAIIVRKLNNISLIFCSFKTCPNEVKRKYNYKFEKN